MLLLAIQPIRVVGGNTTAAAIGAVVALAVACVVLAGMMKPPVGVARRRVLQICSSSRGWCTVLFAIGVMFGLVWAYALNVRRTILG